MSNQLAADYCVLKLSVTVIEQWQCSAAGQSNCDGEMVFTGQMLTEYPPVYLHRCNKCNRQQNTKIGKFPRTLAAPK